MKTQENLQKSCLALVLLALIGLAGCSGDKSPTGSAEGSIVGSWDLTAVKSTYGGQTYNVPAQEVQADPAKYDINSDGTGVQTYQGKQSKFDWTQSGSKLVFSSNVETNSFDFTVNSKTLTLTFTVEVYTITQTFTRQ